MLQELLYLERAECAKEREYRQASLGTAQSDVAELQQTIAEREQRATEADREVAELRVQVERLEELHAEGAVWL